MARGELTRQSRAGAFGIDLTHSVVFIDEYAAGSVLGRFLGGEVGEGRDDDDVARVDQVGGGAVDAHHPRPGWPSERVGREPGSPCYVPDVDLFVFENSCRTKQVVIDRDRSLVVKVGLRHGGSVNLAQQHSSHHARMTVGSAAKSRGFRSCGAHGGGLVITPCRWLSKVLPVGVTHLNPFGVMLMLQPREWVIP